jgi:hypothetical protein
VQASCSAGPLESPYRFEAIPFTRSGDGWVRCLDGNVRQKLYGSQGANLEPDDPDRLPSAYNHGIGDSWIDNTTVPNLMAAAEARLLLAGSKVKKMLIKQIAKKQNAQLATMAAALEPLLVANSSSSTDSGFSWPSILVSSNDEDRAERLRLLKALKASLGREEVASDTMHGDTITTVIEPLPADATLRQAVETAGVDVNGSTFEMLTQSGAPIMSYGQLPYAARQNISSFLRSEFGATVDTATAGGATSDGGSEGDELSAFVVFVKRSNGKIYKDDPKLHRQLLLLVGLSKRWAVVDPAEIEKHVQHRFLGIQWVRSVDLITIDDAGEETMLRPAGSDERTRFRKNKFPYSEAHGLGISTGGAVTSLESLERSSSTEAASGKLENWFASDFEKIAREAELLWSGSSQALPYEQPHEVGQNVSAASSIRATQHTQITRGSAVAWPVFNLQAKPVWVVDIEAFLDICQISASEPDAFMLKLRTTKPSHTPLLQLLQDVRIGLLREFGGRSVDFDFHAVADTTPGWFVLTLVPVAMMEKASAPAYKRNPNTGSTNFDYGISAGTVNSSTGKGNVMVQNEEQRKQMLGNNGEGGSGRECMEKLFELVRFPGARKFVRQLLLVKFGYVDPGPRQAAVEDGYVWSTVVDSALSQIFG